MKNIKVKSKEFTYNAGIIKKYGNIKYKLIWIAKLQNSGLEKPKKAFIEKGSVNDYKLENNIIRGRIDCRCP